MICMPSEIIFKKDEKGNFIYSFRDWDGKQTTVVTKPTMPFAKFINKIKKLHEI